MGDPKGRARDLVSVSAAKYPDLAFSLSVNKLFIASQKEKAPERKASF
jgi:hypothetical protein